MNVYVFYIVNGRYAFTSGPTSVIENLLECAEKLQLLK